MEFKTIDLRCFKCGSKETKFHGDIDCYGDITCIKCGYIGRTRHFIKQVNVYHKISIVTEWVCECGFNNESEGEEFRSGHIMVCGECNKTYKSNYKLF